ncbi:MAG TPA: TMEM175 family protein [Streptosporangiaceae bacterium]|nr:TMEM175 family protein [Streptosporangiaceae bacterium]
MDRGRLEAFSDGVFAVAITLLALNIAVSGRGLQHQLWLHRWSFGAYLLSFFVIGIIWVNHHMLIKSIALVDRTLLFLNLVLLLFVVLIPFSTATVAQYLPVPGEGADVKVAMAMYSAVFLGMSAGFGLIFEWTLHGDHRTVPLPPEAHWPARLRFVGGATVYVVAFVVALFNAIAAFILIAVTAVYYIVERTPTSAAAPPGSPGDPEAV